MDGVVFGSKCHIGSWSSLCNYYLLMELAIFKIKERKILEFVGLLLHS